MDAIKGYGSDIDEPIDQTFRTSKVNEIEERFKLPTLSAAPELPCDIFREGELNYPCIDYSGLTLLEYNPTYEQMYSPCAGPQNPFLSNMQRSSRNTLSGFVEKTNVSNFEFEVQRRTFHSYGYAEDPTCSADCQKPLILGDGESYATKDGLTVFESGKACSKGEKRKRLRNDDPSDVDGYKGPWAPYKDEIRVSRPTEDEKRELEEILAKREKRNRVTENTEEEYKSILHIKDPYDYQGRSFLHIPTDLGVNLTSDNPPVRCFIPKRCIHEYRGHSKGVQKIALFPVSGHIFLTCAMDCKVKLWEFYGQRRMLRTYIAHTQAVRDCSFNNSGDSFLSASYDRTVKYWDTETGTVKGKYTCRKMPYCVTFNPDPGKQHFFLVGCSDKKIACFDTRSGAVVQEYDRHLGAVNTITFVDRNRRIISTSDDKSIRVWEWDIPVDFKYIADPSMHSMPAVAVSRNGNLISGDADGRLVIWDWKSTKLYERINAHNNVCMDVKWHWHETSKVLTAGWDGLVKLWD